MSVVVGEAPTLDPAPERETTRRRRRGWQAVVLVAVLAAGGAAAAVGLSRGPSTPAPTGLTWFWNQTFAQGGMPQYPPGWNIQWRQGASVQTYPAADHCALEVSGQPELITVPCDTGSWHWPGNEPEGGPPAAEFLVVSGGRATLFPVA